MGMMSYELQEMKSALKFWSVSTTVNTTCHVVTLVFSSRCQCFIHSFFYFKKTVKMNFVTFYSTTYFHNDNGIQWNLRIKDTLGQGVLSFIERCPLFGS